MMNSQKTGERHASTPRRVKSEDEHDGKNESKRKLKRKWETRNIRHTCGL
jgi:hypothetical protein